MFVSREIKRKNQVTKADLIEGTTAGSVIISENGGSSLPAKPSELIPDHVWVKLQDSGDTAVNHLTRILTDKKFHLFPLKDQAKFIDMAMNRAYGSADVAIRKSINVNVHVDPESEQGVNALAQLAKSVGRSLPEYSTTYSATRDTSDATDVDGDDLP